MILILNMIVFISYTDSAYRKFHDIDPLAFSEDKKGHISFVTVADSLPQLKVSNCYIANVLIVFLLSDQVDKPSNYIQFLATLHAWTNTHFSGESI